VDYIFLVQRKGVVWCGREQGNTTAQQVAYEDWGVATHVSCTMPAGRLRYGRACGWTWECTSKNGPTQPGFRICSSEKPKVISSHESCQPVDAASWSWASQLRALAETHL
jgi:hypothetical protein